MDCQLDYLFIPNTAYNITNNLKSVNFSDDNMDYQ